MPSWEYDVTVLDAVPRSGRGDPEERAARDNASANYWRSRTIAGERRIIRLEALLETPANQRDAQSLLDAHEECYQMSLMLDSLTDQVMEASEDCYIWYTSYQNAMETWDPLADSHKVIYT